VANDFSLPTLLRVQKETLVRSFQAANHVLITSLASLVCNAHTFIAYRNKMLAVPSLIICNKKPTLNLQGKELQHFNKSSNMDMDPMAIQLHLF
jgi:hypothetical protein